LESARPATTADHESIAALATEAIAELEPTRGGALWSRREARLRPVDASIAAAIDDDATFVVVGTIDEVVLGYGITHVEDLHDGGRLAIVDDLYVTDGARGVGVGEAMMDAVIAWCEGQGCIGVDAMALPGNRATKNFFERFGLTARAIVVHRALGPAAEVTG